ncbi:hypothetical protein D3C73_1124580 [compost metagenome]
MPFPHQLALFPCFLAFENDIKIVFFRVQLLLREVWLKALVVESHFLLLDHDTYHSHCIPCLVDNPHPAQRIHIHSITDFKILSRRFDITFLGRPLFNRRNIDRPCCFGWELFYTLQLLLRSFTGSVVS